MKLLRYGPRGSELPGLLDADGRIRSLAAEVTDIDAAAISPSALDRLRALDAGSLPLVEGNPRLGPCVGGVGKFICIGLNYADHAAESGAEGPARAGDLHEGDQRRSAARTMMSRSRAAREKTDWEVELGVVIGTPAEYVSEADAMEHVAGYCVVNDVSERAFPDRAQRASGPRARATTPSARSARGWSPRDEVPIRRTSSMWLEVDGHRYQNGSTRR